MKKSKLKYRISKYANGEITKHKMDVKALYKHSVRKQWKKIPGQRYQAKVVDVELNLALTDKEEVQQWTNVRLLFVRGSDQETKTQVGKHDWAVFFVYRSELDRNRNSRAICHAMGD